MKINQKRKQIILKGYANVSDVMKFCGVGRIKAQQIYDEIVEKVQAEGLEINALGIHPKRLLDYLGLTENKIFKYAEEEANESV